MSQKHRQKQQRNKISTSGNNFLTWNKNATMTLKQTNKRKEKKQ